MADHRSKSFNYTDGGMQIERYSGRFDPKLPDFRSYSVSYASSYKPNLDIVVAGSGSGKNDFDPKKLGKSRIGSSWSFRDPEFQRKKRVAGYKVYSVEGKVKGSFRKSFRWIKEKYVHVVYG
ncbi:hypothetical protein SSX86_002531 [Deinandra increscens subsp. villosa]|uniref:Uncharacterized protein n=1 Tax=Deinandra increscens subsp. villosa TaxID=3103831 RepID=A0AAP0DWL8_9ASTR